MSITDFRGEYRWLSNFGHSPIHMTNPFLGYELKADTVEHAYQAYKTIVIEEREWVLKSRTPAIARRRGQKVTLRKEWDSFRIMYMSALVKAKFTQNKELAAKLLSTDNHHLVEVSDGWGDKFWGVCEGRGLNHLGRILMNVREEIK